MKNSVNFYKLIIPNSTNAFDFVLNVEGLSEKRKEGFKFFIYKLHIVIIIRLLTIKEQQNM